MKSKTILLLALLITFGAEAVERTDGPAEVVASFHRALESGNAEAALGHLAPDVVIYETGGVEASRDEYASHHLHSDMKFLRSVETTIVDQTSGIDGEHAWILTRTETSGTFGKKTIDLTGTETMLLRKSPEGWKIIHIHWSSRSRSADH
ncbi:MAG: nuclear transport factor 2 family protein [Acidobacteria bacterium]|nr:nuclear transport factor 2 family protein [Acidobacteriota bacterium]